VLTAILTPVVKWLIDRYWPVKKMSPPPTEPPVPKESALDWLKRQLANYRHRLAEGANTPRQVDELTDIIRTYFARQYNLPINAYTSSELNYRLGHLTSLSDIFSIFKECDVFKFTRSSGSGHQLAETCLDRTEKVFFPCTS